MLALTAALAAAGYVPVYDVLDDISEMRALGSYCYDELAENYLADNAELVVTLSPRLCEKFRAHPRVVLIRDGIDLTPFRQGADEGTAETFTRGSITLGFWGTMWEYNLDVPLLRELARRRPEWQWHFIGAYDLDPARPPLAQTLAAPNIHFHPSMPRAALAQAARAFDVCVLPTPVTPFNLARDPLKVYEYLACGKPVVATNLEQLAGMPYVTLTDGAVEFANAVETAARTPPDAHALEKYLAAQTWAKRTDQLLDALGALPPRGHALPPPPAGAMSGTSDEPERWHAYARHLERLVQDREAHVRALEAALQQSSLTEKFKRAVRR